VSVNGERQTHTESEMGRLSNGVDGRAKGDRSIEESIVRYNTSHIIALLSPPKGERQKATKPGGRGRLPLPAELPRHQEVATQGMKRRLPGGSFGKALSLLPCPNKCFAVPFSSFFWGRPLQPPASSVRARLRRLSLGK
jgi:hypothetical protein